MTSLRLIMYYDVISPQSWVAYQLLQKKLPKWRNMAQISVDYKPVNYVQVFKTAYRIRPEGTLLRKRKYLERELYDICDAYGLEKGNFQIVSVFEASVVQRSLQDDTLEQRRTKASLLLLQHLKTELPECYEKFMVAFWRQVWHGSGNVIRTTQYLKIAREIGVPFSVIDRVVMNTEKWDNIVELVNTTRQIREEGAFGCPWFTAVFDDPDFTYPFGDILRLETLETLLSDKELLTRAAQARFQMGANVDDTTTSEIRSYGRLSPTHNIPIDEIDEELNDIEPGVRRRQRSVF
ncbi:glutathione S-transferase kappa 1 isoform 5 [Aphelenchoides avenae]|nr:glutathione S-transferase kappa 1 isoform 5 [Aphelenchus avenae]